MNPKENQPRASIIIIAQNKEAYIDRSIRSLCNQTVQKIEIICVDDGSTDATYERICECAAKDDRIAVIRQENCGTLAARIAGIRKASGAYTMFLDADDIFLPETVETACDAADEQGADVLEFEFELKENPDNPPAKVKIEFLSDLLSQKRPLPEPPCGPALINACFAERVFWWSLVNKTYRTELLQSAVQYYRGEWLCIGEDQLIMLMVLSRTQHFARIEKKLYVYYVGGGMTTSSGALTSPDDLKRWGTKWLALTLARDWLRQSGYPQKEIADAMAAIESEVRGNAVSMLANGCPADKRAVYLDWLSQSCTKEEYIDVVSETIQLLDRQYHSLVDSTCWKLTKPIRRILDKVKGTGKES